MALPTAAQLATLDYAYLGAPFCDVPAKSSIDTSTMDWAYLGAPFVCNWFGAVASGPLVGPSILIGAGLVGPSAQISA